MNDAHKSGIIIPKHPDRGRVEELEAKVSPLESILRRNLGKLRTDSTRQDYLDACQLCGVKPEVWE